MILFIFEFDVAQIITFIYYYLYESILSNITKNIALHQKYMQKISTIKIIFVLDRNFLKSSK